jgi:hypothetical protein
MTKFFIPNVDDETKQTEIWTTFRKSVTTRESLKFDRKVFKILSTHDGERISDEIGQITKANNEKVLLIIETSDIFYVFTPSRGYFKSDPMMVGRSSIISTVYFDE